MRQRNRGFTKIELAVVIACLLILTWIVIPSFNHRPPHRRSQCTNNLKNLALATIQLDATHGHLPGFVNDFGYFPGGADPSDADNFGGSVPSHRKIGPWGVALLPWLDALPTYEHWTEDRYPIMHNGNGDLDASEGVAGIGFHPLSAPRLAIFICPSASTNADGLGHNHYVANNGMCHRGPEGANFWAIQRGNETNPMDFAGSMKRANGAFNNQVNATDHAGNQVPAGPKVKLSDFRDGQSHTLLFSENLQALPWHRAGFVDADRFVASDASQTFLYDPTSRYVHGVVWHFEDKHHAANAPDVNPLHRINGTYRGIELTRVSMSLANAHHLARPSSAHVGGVNAAMADGATRFISDSIDYRVYQALLTLHGKASDVPEPKFVVTDEHF